MNDDFSKLRHQQQQQGGLQKSASTGQREFAGAEELLRHDANNTTPPDAILERLGRSLAADPIPKRNWWQRLFSK
jgi:hypothetical protein